MATINLRNVDLNLLIVFDAVFATGNISHAARQLALSQPAVSNALTRLREHFDDPLFVRAGRGVKPTNRSQQMIEPVREALRLIRQQFDGGRTLDLASYKRHVPDRDRRPAGADPDAAAAARDHPRMRRWSRSSRGRHGTPMSPTTSSPERSIWPAIPFRSVRRAW